jgi:hypothetical protein
MAPEEALQQGRNASCWLFSFSFFQVKLVSFLLLSRKAEEMILFYMVPPGLLVSHTLNDPYCRLGRSSNSRQWVWWKVKKINTAIVSSSYEQLKRLFSRRAFDLFYLYPFCTYSLWFVISGMAIYHCDRPRITTILTTTSPSPSHLQFLGIFGHSNWAFLLARADRNLKIYLSLMFRFH